MNGLKRKPAYSEKELRVIDQKPGFMGMAPPTDLFDTPVSVRENMNSHYFDKDPWYCATLRDTTSLQLKDYADEASRARLERDSALREVELLKNRIAELEKKSGK